MQEKTHYVTYYVAQQQRLGARSLSEGNREINVARHQQEQAIEEFFAKAQTAERLATFTEMPDSRRSTKWPELQKALELCQRQAATLLIAELGTLTSNEVFAQFLLDSGVKFHCLDQPFVDQNILEALSKHAQVQRKLHGKLIREGLKMTSAKSGNPNAAEVISKVNKPKIDTAIVFALVLQPIISDYRRKGYSQRQMVKTLNDEGFTAPEGGKWVLSQLQKVLDRVRLNEIAAETTPLLKNVNANAEDNLASVVELLNSRGILALKRGPWDEAQAKKLMERIKQIDEIESINRFVLKLLPSLHHYRHQSLSSAHLLLKFYQAGIPINQAQVQSQDQTEAQAQVQIQGDERALLEQLKQAIKELPEGTETLEQGLESAAKHIPTYLKIIKGHIEQLAKVLELETHDHRKLENVGLASPVLQLMQLFRELNAEDISLIETLAYEAPHWQAESAPVLSKEATAA